MWARGVHKTDGTPSKRSLRALARLFPVWVFGAARALSGYRGAELGAPLRAWIPAESVAPMHWSAQHVSVLSSAVMPSLRAVDVDAAALWFGGAFQGATIGRETLLASRLSLNMDSAKNSCPSDRP